MTTLEEAFAEVAEVAEEWHYAKNCGFGPDDFSPGSSVNAWWECRFCLRAFKARVNNRTSNESGCPYCTNKAKSISLHELVEK
jgi:hypothetical protein